MLTQVRAQLVAEVTDDRGRLVADLTRAQALGDLGHRLQLLAHAEAVGGGGGGEPAGRGDPGARGLAGKQVVASPLGRGDHPAELALEPIHGGSKSPGVYEIEIGVALEVTNCGLEAIDL